MPAAVLDEIMVHGTTHKFRLEVINERTEALVNITAWAKFWCTAKAAKTDADGAAALQLTSLTAAITLVDASNGLIEITIPDTAFSSAAYVGATTHLYLDVKGKDASGLHWALGIGRLTVQGEVTQST